jgi:hypothetical protein
MSNEEFRDELNRVLRRYAGDLEPDDLRQLAADLDERADKVEAMEL